MSTPPSPHDVPSALSLISILPDDILQQIFITLIEASWVKPDELKAKETQLPCLIASVDSHWRDLALSTPRLWSRVYIRVGYDQASTKKRLERAAVWIERSRLCTLDLILHAAPSASECHTVGEAVLPHLHRVTTLVLIMEGEEASRLTQSWERSDSFTLAKLRRLEILPRFWNLSWGSVVTLLLSTPTSLAHLVCPRTAFPDNNTIPWSTIKTFKGGVTPECLASLFLSPGRDHIEVLQLHFGNAGDKWEGSPMWTPSTPYPPLSRVSALFLSSEHLDLIYHHFPPLPALRHLSIHPEHDDRSIQEITQLLQLWGSRLISFRLPKDCGSAEAIDAMLSLVPNLEALRLQHGDFETSLSVNAPRQTALKKLLSLRHLEIVFDDLSDFHDALTGIEEYLQAEPRASFLQKLTLIFPLESGPPTPDPSDSDPGSVKSWISREMLLESLEQSKERLAKLGITLYCMHRDKPVDYRRGDLLDYRFDTEYYMQMGGVFTQLWYHAYI